LTALIPTKVKDICQNASSINAREITKEQTQHLVSDSEYSTNKHKNKPKYSNITAKFDVIYYTLEIYRPTATLTRL